MEQREWTQEDIKNLYEYLMGENKWYNDFWAKHTPKENIIPHTQEQE